jgi:branched-chain amino acid transport system ATP-binding protein
LLHKANTLAASLTLLERKRLELTRALCAKPRLLLLDEIAGGLTEAECASLVLTIKDIHASGVTIIWIEHVVHALLAVVDRLIVIDFGKKIAEGEPHAIMASPQVQEIYLGIAVDA